MLIIINNKTKQSYFTKCFSKAAELVGCSPASISRWERAKLINNQEPFENYNDFTIYFRAKQLKSNKGHNKHNLIQYK